MVVWPVEWRICSEGCRLFVDQIEKVNWGVQVFSMCFVCWAAGVM